MKYCLFLFMVGLSPCSLLLLWPKGYGPSEGFWSPGKCSCPGLQLTCNSRRTTSVFPYKAASCRAVPVLVCRLISIPAFRSCLWGTKHRMSFSKQKMWQLSHTWLHKSCCMLGRSWEARRENEKEMIGGGIICTPETWWVKWRKKTVDISVL